MGTSRSQEIIKSREGTQTERAGQKCNLAELVGAVRSLHIACEDKDLAGLGNLHRLLFRGNVVSVRFHQGLGPNNNSEAFE